jgi:indoleamine 2,3-dioxygenase
MTSDMSLTIDQFPYLSMDPSTLPPAVDPFTVTIARGFMPTQDPQVNLPWPFNRLTGLCLALPGLLNNHSLGWRIDSGSYLLDLTDKVEDACTDNYGQFNLATVAAIFRDYSFLASAYLLEPCWQRSGKGRTELPRCIAGPLVKCANM